MLVPFAALQGPFRRQFRAGVGSGGSGVSVLGNRVLRTEDPRMLTEGARYVADLRIDGAVRACFVRSTAAAGA